MISLDTTISEFKVKADAISGIIIEENENFKFGYEFLHSAFYLRHKPKSGPWYLGSVVSSFIGRFENNFTLKQVMEKLLVEITDSSIIIIEENLKIINDAVVLNDNAKELFAIELVKVER